MWNNKRIKVHETICIGLIKKGDIITVDDNKGIILTVNGKKIDPNQGTWAFPHYGCEEWEVIPDFEIGKWYSFKAYNSDNILKVSSITSYISGTPWILEKEYNSTGTWPSDACSEIKELKVEDECIQSVLPEGHEDKIKSVLSLIKGEAYYHEFNSYSYIFECSESGKTTGGSRVGIQDSTWKNHYSNRRRRN